jgi:hypothetical protein
MGSERVLWGVIMNTSAEKKVCRCIDPHNHSIRCRVQRERSLEMSKRREEDQQFTVLSTLFQLGHIVITTVRNIIVTVDPHGMHFYTFQSFDGPFYFFHFIPITDTFDLSSLFAIKEYAEQYLTTYSVHTRTRNT